jgi:hypothetical protein
MSYVKNGLKQILATETMGFRHEADEVSSNNYFSIINPEYDILIEGSTEELQFQCLLTQ